MDKSILTLALLIACFCSVAEVEPRYQYSGKSDIYTANSWLISAGQYQLDDDRAKREGIEDDAVYVSGSYQFQYEGFLFGIGISALVYDDNEEFTVRVENRWGNRSNRDSDATGYGVFGQLGYSLAMRSDRTLSVDFLGGYERLWSERSVSFCDDCPEEDIDIEGGAFAKASVRWIITRPYTLSLNLKQFFTDSVDTGVDLTFGWTLY